MTLKTLGPKMGKKLVLTAAVLLASVGIASAATVTNDLNLRSGPSTGYRVIDTMPAGAHVNVLGCTGSWCRVNFRGEVGYASASYLGGGGYVAAAPVYSAPVYYSEPYYAAPVFGFGFGFGGHRGGWHRGGGHRGGGWHHSGGHHSGGHHGGGHHHR